MIGVGGLVLGWVLVGIAASLIMGGLAPRVWPHIRRVRLRWPVYVSPTDTELARKRENEAFGHTVIEKRSPDTPQESLQLQDRLRQLEAENKQLKEQIPQPNDEDLKRHCCELAAEVFEFYKRQRENIEQALQSDPLIALSKEPARSQRRSEEIERHDKKMVDRYSEQLGGKVSAMCDDLEQRGWFAPEARQRLENPAGPQDIRYVARRLAAICSRSDFDPQKNSVQQNQTQSTQQPRSRQEHRRQRIEEWRSVIRSFNFDTERFTSTDAYPQMRPHLQPNVKRKLEHPGMVIVGNTTRGEHAHRYMLLDEITRIEKEWNLV